MKKVALLADSWNRLVTADWINGINKYNAYAEEPVTLLHYNSMGNWSTDTVYNQGEYNIYDLSDLTQFDGMIIDVNNIYEKNHLNHILKLVHESHVPTVSLGYYIDDLYYVGVDNARAITTIMEHVHDVHRCRRFIFVGGPTSNSENMVRAKAYRECLAKWGLKEEDNPLFFGSFEMVSGEETFQKILDMKLPMPDAFICANDNLAVGLMDAAQAHGYVIPRDFCVTGFDNLDKAFCYNPQVTTVAHNRIEMGDAALQILHDVWEGKETAKDHFIKPDVTFTESCGCPIEEQVDFRRYVKESIVQKEKQRVFEQQLVDLESVLSKISGFDKIFREVGELFKKLDCEGATLVVDSRLQDLVDLSQFPVEGYDHSKLEVVYDTNFDENSSYMSYDEFMEKITVEKQKSVHMISPLHFYDRSIGLIIIRNPMFLYDNPCFYNIQNLLIKTLWENYQKESLKKANQRLDELYQQDALTGLYNRMAYFKTIEPMLDEIKQAGKHCLIAFFDCDNFKEINDTKGHDEGDKVLIRVGQILKQDVTKEGAAFRFGGDEFVIANPCDSVEEADQICIQIAKDFCREKIGISIGRVVAHPDEEKTIQEYINAADQDMYEQKRKKKI